MGSRLVKLRGDIYYLPGRTNIGVIVRDDWCIVVDTGIDEDSGRKAVNAVRREGLEVKYVLNTHSHADHIGGNRFLAMRAGAAVLAPRLEDVFIEHPILEPLYLYGASPPKSLRGKFTMASPSRVSRVLCEGVDEELGVEVIPLPGHSVNMVGVAADRVFFAADSIFPERLVEKFGVLYHLDARAAAETLERLRGLKYAVYLPSHSEPLSDLTKLIDLNLESIWRARVAVEEAADGAKAEEAVSRVLRGMGIRVDSPALYHLYFSAVKSYLAWLVDEGVLREEVKEGELRYVRA